MGTPLTMILHESYGVTVTLPSKFVKIACLSEILRRKAFAYVTQEIQTVWPAEVLLCHQHLQVPPVCLSLRCTGTAEPPASEKACDRGDSG